MRRVGERQTITGPDPLAKHPATSRALLNCSPRAMEDGHG